MHRFYIDQLLKEGEICALSDADSHHAVHVLRLAPGAEVQLMDGQSRYRGILCAMAPKVTVEVGQPLPSTEPRLQIHLYQGLPKGDKMEMIVQKAVELGMAAVVPVAMGRCVVKLSDKDGARKQERWQRIAIEAGKQSGRCRQMEVAPPLPFARMVKELAGRHDAVIVPWEDAKSMGPASFAEAHPDIRSLGVLIGPEGGFSPEEMEQLKSSGAVPMTLGPRILRTETAGMAVVAGLMCLYGEMEGTGDDGAP